MYIVLGWINVVLLAVMTAPVWLRFLNTRTLRLKGGVYGKSIKYLRAIHKPIGIAIVILALIHGYLALGVLRVHTGSILWTAVFIGAFLGGLFFYTKKRHLFVWHRRVVALAILMLLIHLLFPSAVYYLFRI